MPLPQPDVSASESPRRRRIPIAAAVAALALASTVAAANAAPGLGLTAVAAQAPGGPGVTSPNNVSPELYNVTVAQGSMQLENPDGIVRYYGYLDNGTLMPTGSPLSEAQKTEPDKNTYLEINGLTGADLSYSYGTHFVFQGHELGPRGYITRINLDADPSHRVTLISDIDNNGANLPDIDGSVWNPFSQNLLVSWEGNGSSTGGIWSLGLNPGSVATNLQGIIGRGGYEGMQLDPDGNIWIVEDIGGKSCSANPTDASCAKVAKQPNSFIFKFVPKDTTNVSLGGKLWVLQAKNGGTAVTFHGIHSGASNPTQTEIDNDVSSAFMSSLHTYGSSFPTSWVLVHDTDVNGTTAFDANLGAKIAGGTPFKRPENGQFRPASKFTEFLFTETGDTNALSSANAGLGGWGGVLKLTQNDPSATTGTLTPFFLGDQAHTGLDNITFVDKDWVAVVEDAGKTLHDRRSALDSAYLLQADLKPGAAPVPFRFIGEGRDPSATMDASVSPVGFGKNEDDNELTGIHMSDGSPTIKGLIGTKDPQYLNTHGKSEWRLFWTQQHGDNPTYELVPSAR
jgi:hypothetical protein